MRYQSWNKYSRHPGMNRIRNHNTLSNIQLNKHHDNQKLCNHNHDFVKTVYFSTVKDKEECVYCIFLEGSCLLRAKSF